MLTLRPTSERGNGNFGWLDSAHSFSFGGYHDRAHMGFGALRVINEDHVKGGAGFETHPHKDMEIITYVLEGALAHRDSTDKTSVIRPGRLQRMSAGTGISHSEMNHSQTENVHFLQIWILPDRTGLSPSYEEMDFDLAHKANQLMLVATRNGKGTTLNVHQDMDIYAARLDAGKSLTFSARAGRKQWLQLARGAISLNTVKLAAGDGLAIEDEETLEFSAREDAEFLLFDTI